MEHNRIKELREDRDIKQREIAAYLKVAQNTYSNYENGVREFPLEISDSTFSFLSGQSGIFAWIDRYTDTVTTIETTKNKTPEALKMLRVLHFCP